MRSSVKNILFALRRFFFGVRIFLPLVPRFTWLAVQEVGKSTVEYWKNSQVVVNSLSDSYLDQAMEKMPTEYSVGVFRTCYGLASLLYLLIWIAMSWVTIEALQWLLRTVF
jgi:hypothetical protein